VRLLRILFVAGVVLFVGTCVRARAADPDAWQWATSGGPIATVAVSITSASATGLSGGACFRVSCSAQVFFRVGVAPVTALTSDSILPSPWVERVCLRNGYNSIAFIVATGTATCSILSLASSP
jgi:hypothetical protein